MTDGLEDVRRRLTALEEFRARVEAEEASMETHVRSTLEQMKALDRHADRIVDKGTTLVERTERLLDRNRRAIAEEQAKVVGDLVGERLYTQAQVDELVGAARVATQKMTAEDALRYIARASELVVTDDHVAQDRRVRALERELDGLYNARRGRRVAGADPDDVWCRACGHETASLADGSLCGDCADVA